MKFGFTNDVKILEWPRQFRDDAVADGWSIKATYESESIDRASKLTIPFESKSASPYVHEPNGWKMSILTRDNSDRNYRCKYEAEVNVWGPDGLVVHIPLFLKYSMGYLMSGLRKCNVCGTEDVDTQRYSFAGRCCANCRPEMARKHEQPGWTK